MVDTEQAVHSTAKGGLDRRNDSMEEDNLGGGDKSYLGYSEMIGYGGDKTPLPMGTPNPY